MKGKSIFLLILMALSLVLAACEAEDVKFLENMADEWARAHKSNPRNQDGSIDIEGAINAGWNATGLPGNDGDVTAAIDAKNVVDSIRDADQKAEQAQEDLKKGKPQDAVKKLDEAIKNRPSDWWLLDQRGVANIEAGNGDLGNRDLQSAYGNAKRGQAAEHQRQLLFESITRQRMNGGLARCSTYKAMANAYSDLLNSGTGDANFYRSQLTQNTQAASQPGVTCR